MYGPGYAVPPTRVKVTSIKTTREMLEAVQSELRAVKYDAAILSAAAADYGPAERGQGKTPSGKDSWVITLEPLPKVIENIKTVDPGIYLVGFKAEHGVSDEELVERAYERLESGGLDLIVANDVSREGVGFGTSTNEVFIVDGNRVVERVASSKLAVASRILDRVKDALLG